MTPEPPHRPYKRHHHLPPISAAGATSCTPSPVEGATTAVARLPYDLIFEILSRVPVRSACRFRCVSKRWYTLISDPTFLAAHKSLHNEPLIISSSRKNTDGRRDLQLMDMKGNVVRVTKGVHGTRLLSSSSDDVCIVDDYYDRVHVLDPVTGEVLEESPEQPPQECWENQYYISNIEFGFGHAVPSGVSKVVRVTSDLTCKVFTLGADTTWRQSRSPPIHTCFDQNNPVVANGVMYFLVAAPMVGDHDLLCFDLETEEWIKRIGGPRKVVGSELWKRSGIIRIAELNETLCMVQPETYITDNKCTNIWLLADFDNEIWIKAYTIPMPLNTSFYMPLRMVHDNGKLIFYNYLHKQGRALQIYDRHTGTCTMLRLLENVAGRIIVCSLHLDRFVSAKI